MVGPGAGDVARETWVFDVDGCVVDSLTGTSLRPGARELLETLRARDVAVVWWSGGGAEHARRRAEHVRVVELVDGYVAKLGRDADGAYVLDHVVDDPRFAVFVDDHPEDLPAWIDVIAVSTYLSDNPHDRGLAEAGRRGESAKASPPTSARTL